MPGHFWIVKPGVDSGLLGWIPSFLNHNSDEPAAKQFHRMYAHGGGWKPFRGFKLLQPRTAEEGYRISYPGDPVYKELARTVLPLTSETVVIFPHAWVAVVQKDGTYEIARMD